MENKLNTEFKKIRAWSHCINDIGDESWIRYDEFGNEIYYTDSDGFERFGKCIDTKNKEYLYKHNYGQGTHITSTQYDDHGNEICFRVCTDEDGRYVYQRISEFEYDEVGIPIQNRNSARAWVGIRDESDQYLYHYIDIFGKSWSRKYNQYDDVIVDEDGSIVNRIEWGYRTIRNTNL